MFVSSVPGLVVKLLETHSINICSMNEIKEKTDFYFYVVLGFRFYKEHS